MVSDMYYHIRCMHVKYPLNRDNRFVKTVITKKYLNCINLQLAIRIWKNHSFQTCITRPPIFVSNLRPIDLLVIVEPRSKVFFYERRTDGRTDGRTDIASDNIIKVVFFEKKKLLTSLVIYLIAIIIDLLL